MTKKTKGRWVIVGNGPYVVRAAVVGRKATRLYWPRVDAIKEVK